MEVQVITFWQESRLLASAPYSSSLPTHLMQSAYTRSGIDLSALCTLVARQKEVVQTNMQPFVYPSLVNITRAKQCLQLRSTPLMIALSSLLGKTGALCNEDESFSPSTLWNF